MHTHPSYVAAGAADRGAVRPAAAADLPAVWRFSAEVYPAFRGCSYADFRAVWEHRWDGNPAMAPGLPRGWVLEDTHGEVHGFCGLVPIRFKVGERTATALCGSNWYVRPEWRGHSLRGFRRHVALAADHLLLSTGLSAAAARVHGGAGGMEPMPVPGADRALWWIVDPRRFLAWKARGLAVARSGPLSLVASRPALAVLGKALPVALGLVTEPRRGALRWLAPARVAFDCPALDVALVDRFTDEFDDFWARSRGLHDVAVERTSAFLDWRHRLLPRFAGECFAFACRQRGRLLGYAAVQAQGYGGRLEACYVVTDLCYPPDREDVLQNLMNAVFRFVVERDGVVLKLSGFHPLVYAALAGQRPHVIDPATLHGLADGGLAGGLRAALGLGGRRRTGRRMRPLSTCWFKAPAGELSETLRHGSWWPSGVDGTSNL